MSNYNNDPNKNILNTGILTVYFNKDINSFEIIVYQNDLYKYETFEEPLNIKDKHITDIYINDKKYLIKIYMTKISLFDTPYKKISLNIFNDKIRRKSRMISILNNDKIYSRLKEIEESIKLKIKVTKL
jgi:hypothetical protein